MSRNREKKSNLFQSIFCFVLFLATEQNILLQHALPKEEPVFLGV